MNFDFAAVKKNRRLRIFILRINRRDLFVDCRFAQARDAQHARRKPSIARQFVEPRAHVILEHRFHLTRRSGH